MRESKRLIRAAVDWTRPDWTTEEYRAYLNWYNPSWIRFRTKPTLLVTPKGISLTFGRRLIGFPFQRENRSVLAIVRGAQWV